MRYTGASVVCTKPDNDGEADIVAPAAVFEVLSPSTALTDRGVKAVECAGVPTIEVHVMLETDQLEIPMLRRLGGGNRHRGGTAPEPFRFVIGQAAWVTRDD